MIVGSHDQVVIPEEFRKALGLEVDAQFVVQGDGDTVVLKRIAVPAKSKLRAMLGKVRSQARRAGLILAAVPRCDMIRGHAYG